MQGGTIELNIPPYCPAQITDLLYDLKFGGHPLNKKLEGKGKRKKKKKGEKFERRGKKNWSRR